MMLEPSRILSDDHLEAIHSKSLRVLEEIGMDILLPEAPGDPGRCGATVSGERVRIGREIVEAALEDSALRIHFPCPQSRSQYQNRRQMDCLRPGWRSSQLFRPRHGRRPGTLADTSNFLKLSQFFNCIHSPVTARSMHWISVRKFAICTSCATRCIFLTRCPSSTRPGRDRLLDSLEITRLARGISDEQMRRSRRPTRSSTPIRR